MMPDITSRRYGSRGSPFASPFGSPFISRRVSSGLVSGASDAAEGGEAAAGTGGDQQQAALQNPLLLARVRNGILQQIAVSLPGSWTNKQCIHIYSSFVVCCWQVAAICCPLC